MNIVFLFIIGLAVAYFFCFYSKSDDCNKDYMLGILGALVGGFVLDNFNFIYISDFSIITILFGIITALGLIYTGRTLRRI